MEKEQKKRNWKKHLLIIASIPIILAVIAYLGYQLYERYNSRYTYNYDNQIFITGKYKNINLTFNSLDINLNPINKVIITDVPVLRPEELAIKIDGKFYNVSELTPKKLKQFKNCYTYKCHPQMPHKEKLTLLYELSKNEVVGLINFDFKKGELLGVYIIVKMESKLFSPEIRYKNDHIFKLPITLSELNHSLPGFKYYSRGYTPFDAKLREWLF